jgi:SOS-response transcriptional repressor LexA
LEKIPILGNFVPQIDLKYRRYFLSCQVEMSKFLYKIRNFMDWKRIIDILEDKCSKSGFPLYKILEVRSQFISDLRSGKSKTPNAEFLARIITKLGINPEWFEDDSKTMFYKDIKSPYNKSRLEQDLDETIAAHPKFTEIESRLSALERLVSRETPPSGEYTEEKIINGGFTAEPEPEYIVEEWVTIPYVRDIAAGPPIPQAEDTDQYARAPARLIKKGHRYYAASIRGGSMAEASIRDGDTVLIRYSGAPRDGAIQVVRCRDRSTLKRLREVEGKGWEIHYEDGTGTVVPLNSAQYEIQGDFIAILPENGGGGQA